MTNPDLIEMQQLLFKDNVSVVYLEAVGDYWLNREEFCKNFCDAPVTNDVVIHVKFEGLSFTHAVIPPVIEQLIKTTGRRRDSVYIFSPNSITNDTYWKNIFWRKHSVSDEFPRSNTYWRDDTPELVEDFKTWALFVGRRTTPRLLALYKIWNNPVLKQNCLLSAMTHPAAETTQIFDQPEKTYDQLEQWIPVENKMQKILEHNSFRKFCEQMPVSSADGYSLNDQYTDAALGENRNAAAAKSLIDLSGSYLFEITFETMTLGFTFTPSEKTIRTVVAEKPLLVYAPANFLANLRTLGFQTFGELWDESYDSLEGPERFNAMMHIVQQVSELPREKQLELYSRSRAVCTHNKVLLKELINSNNTFSPYIMNIFLSLSAHVRPGPNAKVTVKIDQKSFDFELEPTINWVPSSSPAQSRKMFCLIENLAPPPEFDVEIRALDNDVLICGYNVFKGQFVIVTQPTWDDPNWQPYDVTGHDGNEYNGPGSLQILAGQTVKFRAQVLYPAPVQSV